MSSEITETKTMIESVRQESLETVADYHTDFLRTQLSKAMHLKVPVPDDELYIKEFTAKLARLEFLEDQLDQMAKILNCSRDDVLAEMLIADDLLVRAETAEAELKSEREKFSRTLVKFRDDVTRVTQACEVTEGQCGALVERLEKLETENKRLKWWERLFGREEEEEKPANTPEKLEILQDGEEGSDVQ